MGSEKDEEFTFVCPACEESLEVDRSMKVTLVERGCVICGTPVTEEAFPEDPVADSS